MEYSFPPSPFPSCCLDPNMKFLSRKGRKEAFSAYYYASYGISTYEERGSRGDNFPRRWKTKKRERERKRSLHHRLFLPLPVISAL